MFHALLFLVVIAYPVNAWYASLRTGQNRILILDGELSRSSTFHRSALLTKLQFGFSFSRKMQEQGVQAAQDEPSFFDRVRVLNFRIARIYWCAPHQHQLGGRMGMPAYLPGTTDPLGHQRAN